MTDAGYPSFPPAPQRLHLERRSNGFAVAALACGVVGLPQFFFPVPAAVAVVLGVIGHRKARDLGGEIMALIAATLGVVALVLFGVLLIRNLYDITHAASISNVQVGTCLKEVYPERDVVRKDCSARPGSEVVGIVQHPSPPGAAYPKGFELNFRRTTSAAHGSRTMSAYRTSSRRRPTVCGLPHGGQWRRGDRTVVCFAVGKPALPFVGSVRGVP